MSTPRFAPDEFYCRYCPTDTVFVVPSLARDHEVTCFFNEFRQVA